MRIKFGEWGNYNTRKFRRSNEETDFILSETSRRVS